MFTKILLLLPLYATFAAAICPGFNFAIGNQLDAGNGLSHWNVYDDSCNVVDGLTTGGNPCDAGKFGCSGAPVTFNEYNSPSNGQFACRPDPNSGSCGSDVISVCCRNDGN